MRRMFLAALALTGIAAGCGSARKPEPRSVAGIRVSQRQLASDFAGGHYAKACEGYTSALRAALDARASGGCAGILELGVEISHVFCKMRQLPQRVRQQSCPYVKNGLGYAPRIPPGTEIRGDTAYAKDNVFARYERGRWRFETRPGGLERLSKLGRVSRLSAGFPALHAPRGETQRLERLLEAHGQSTITVGNAP